MNMSVNVLSITDQNGLLIETIHSCGSPPCDSFRTMPRAEPEMQVHKVVNGLREGETATLRRSASIGGLQRRRFMHQVHGSLSFHIAEESANSRTRKLLQLSCVRATRLAQRRNQRSEISRTFGALFVLLEFEQGRMERGTSSPVPMLPSSSFIDSADVT
jgi:hypothetical protein